METGALRRPPLKMDYSTRIDQSTCTSSHWHDLTSSYRMYIPLSAHTTPTKKEEFPIHQTPAGFRKHQTSREQPWDITAIADVLLRCTALARHQSLRSGESSARSYPMPSLGRLLYIHLIPRSREPSAQAVRTDGRRRDRTGEQSERATTDSKKQKSFHG